jgi:hypothetical protein
MTSSKADQSSTAHERKLSLFHSYACRIVKRVAVR